MKYQRYEPCPALQQYISYYWYMESGEDEKQEYPDLLIPDGYPEVIFILEGSYYKRPLVNKSQVAMVDSSSVVGIQHQSLLVKRASKVKLWGIKFKPLGFYRCFGPTVIQTVGNTQAINEFGFPYLLALEQSLRSEKSFDDAVALIDRAQRTHVAKMQYSKREDILRVCINQILRTKGNITLNELSENAQKSKRQIQRYFRECVGISPKKFSNIIRFKSFYKENVLIGASLNQFFDHGYFDQSHFIKDFRANLGVTPSSASSQKFRAQNEIAKKSIRR